MTKTQRDRETNRGYNDYIDGKPISAYYDGRGRLTESRRAIYEIGWHAAKCALNLDGQGSGMPSDKAQLRSEAE